MKEICIINYNSKAAIYGIGTYIKEYISCLRKIGCRINLIELGTDSATNEFYIKEEGNIRKIYIPNIHNGMYEKFNKSVCRMLRMYIEDSENLVFHFHYTQSDSLLDLVKKHFPLSKTVITIHYLSWSAPLQGNSALFEKIISKQENEKIKKEYNNIIDNYNKEKAFVEKADHIICLSKDTFDLMNNLYLIKSKMWLIPNGLSNQKRILSEKERIKLREKFYINPHEKVLLFVGRIDSIKGIYLLTSCFENVVKNYPDCKLVIIGDGNINEAIKKCKNVYSKMLFTSKLDKQTLYQWYQIAEIALFPSFYEECSYVGIEMMMHGLPVVASDGYSVKNMFHDGVNAKIAKIGNQKRPKEFETNLKNAILELLNSESLCKQLSKGAKQTYKSCYTISKMQEGYMKMFNSL